MGVLLDEVVPKPDRGPRAKSGKQRKQAAAAAESGVAETETETPATGAERSGRRSGAGRRRKPVVVGVAASAGGLEALGSLITHLPAKSSLSYVVVQHMAPQHRSMLSQLLGRQTKLRVVEISDGMKVESDVIYVTPPNRDLEIHRGKLLLREPHSSLGPKPSVDQFFTSLAEDQGENAIGVILSGTGSDGAHGIRAIKAAGGITIAQDEGTAKYTGMPRSAIDTGCVDFILAPERIGGELDGLSDSVRRPALALDSETTTDQIKRLMLMVKRQFGIDFTNYKSTTITRRLKRRMAAVRVESLDEYLKHVQATPTELEELRNDILISVTSFFRDNEAFTALGGLLPDLLRDKNPGDTVRIWISGAASGEEAYTLAILLHEVLGDAVNSYQFQIFATDVDMDALARARKGVYPEAALQNVERSIMQKYFLTTSGGYQLRKSIRDMIVFAKHDLIQDPPFLRIDLICCRNLLIYFNTGLQQRVINTFHYALNPGRYMFLGKSETVGSASGLFQTVDKTWKIYRRLGEARIMPRDPSGATYQPRPVEPRRVRRDVRDNHMAEVVQTVLMTAYAPPSVVIDGHGQLLHVHGDVTDYLALSQGAPELNVFGLVKKALKNELRSMMVRVQQTRERCAGAATTLPGREGTRQVRIVVQPLQPNNEGLFLVAFEPVDAMPAADAEMSEKVDGSRVRELEQELSATRENLQTVVEELETSNEELQSLNEELQASNEELQSSNEELETTNEELQSTNEELTTVNQELQIKTAELAAVNIDLENVMASIGMPLIVVDDRLRISRFNVNAASLLDLKSDDVGQYITAAPASADIAQLRDRLRSVLIGGGTEEMEARVGARSFWLRILPYNDDRGLTCGAVLVFIDASSMPSAQSSLIDFRQFESFAGSLGESFWCVDLNEKVFKYLSRDVNAVIADDAIEAAIDDVDWARFVHPDDLATFREAWARHLGGGAMDCRIRTAPGNGAERLLWCHGFHVKRAESGHKFAIGMFADISWVSGIADTVRQRMLHPEDPGPAQTDKLLTGLLHHLRDPVSALTQLPTLMRAVGVQADKAGRLQELIEGSSDFLRIVHDVLELVHVDTGAVTMADERLNFVQILRSCARSEESAARVRSIKLMADIEDDIPDFRGDPRRLRLLVDRLLSWLFDGTPRGGWVRLIGKREPKQSMVTLIAQSSGTMPPDSDHDLRFEIVSTMARLHGVDPVVEHTPGAGTTVRLRFSTRNRQTA